MPPPEPSLVDQVLDNLPYVGAGLGVLVLLGALAVRAVKRRRESKSDSEESGPARTGAAVAVSGAAAAFSGTESDLRGASARAAKDIAEEVDPVAEAEIFMAYGRDGQAEELLKEALAATPGRHEVSLKLLQIYAKRKDAKAFEQTARELQQGTGGSGEIWDQAVRLGYQVDPGNPRYAAGRPTGDEADAPGRMFAGPSVAENVDFNIGVDDPAATTATDIDLGDSGGDLDKTQVFGPGEFAPGSEDSAGEPTMAMDLNLDLPETGSGPETGGGSIDFEISLDNIPASSEARAGEPEAPAPSGGIDFDMGSLSMEPAVQPKSGLGTVPEIDLSGISLDLGTETTPQTSPTGKDDHWYDVQTKFDLAKAYQEMGDKDGARDILREVLQEGDAEQKSAAQAVLASLDS
jgi:pilus assembly protein FimV